MQAKDLMDCIFIRFRAEIERNRNQVIEINHFLDKQREELEKITASPLGLMLLPKEVQDALQI